jgi:hypothetical protein
VSALERRLPELYRSWITECAPARLALGAATTLGLGGVYWGTASWSDKDPGKTLFLFAFWTQVATLVVYGAIRVSASIAEERDAKTWDLQRLTPLTSGELALGKLLGAPLYAAILAALMLPWTLCGAFLSPEIGGKAAFVFVQLAATAFFAWSAALTASSYSDVSKGGSSATAGAIIGLASLYTLGPVLGGRPDDALTYFGARWPVALWLPLATASFGLWAFLAAKWRVGRDLLEPPRFWRLPAFLVFLLAFVLGFDKSSASFALIWPAGAVLMAALACPAGPEAWRRWRAASGAEKLDRTPVWITGAATCAAAALALTALGGGPSPGQGADLAAVYRRLPLLLALYLIRDAAFVQMCRFTKSRRPEAMAVVFLGLAYLLPSIMLTAAKSTALLCLFMPVVEPTIGWVPNLFPAVAWAAAAVAALAALSRRPT